MQFTGSQLGIHVNRYVRAVRFFLHVHVIRNKIRLIKSVYWNARARAIGQIMASRQLKTLISLSGVMIFA